MKTNQLIGSFLLVFVAALSSCGNNSGGDDKDPELKYVDPSSVTLPRGCFQTKEQYAYSLASWNAVSYYADGSEEMSNPNGNVIKFTESGANYLQLSTNSYFEEDPTTSWLDVRNFKVTGMSEVRIKNLFSDKQYYWRTFATDDYIQLPLEMGEFKTYNCLPRFIDIEDLDNEKIVTNVRDMGGYESLLGGKIKQGMIYRGGRMSNSAEAVGTYKVYDEPTAMKGVPKMTMSDAGYKTLSQVLGMRGEIDLRNDRIPYGEKADGSIDYDSTDNYIENGGRNINKGVIPCMGENGDDSRLCIAGLYAQRSAMLEDLDGAPHYLTSGYEQIEKAFHFYANPDNYPNYVHCYIGTDRTGCVCYILECLLGMKTEDMYKDYLWSNFGNIGGSRTIDAIKRYEKKLKSYGKDTMARNAAMFLMDHGISAEEIKTIRSILIEK